MALNNQQQHGFDSKEGERRQENAIRIGRIIEARYDENQSGAPPENNDNPYFHNKDVNGSFRGPLYRVEMGDHKIYWMPQLHLRAGGDQEYWPLEVGEQVLVLCLAGDPMQSYILPMGLPTDAVRPPVGHDDQSADKRPWRDSLHRIRYKDGKLWEYDRYLHRELEVWQDGTRFIRWFLDDREDRSPRQKETNSDQIGGPPRHWQHHLYADGAEHEVVWDEDPKIHHRHWIWPDAVIHEYTWDEQNQEHIEHWLMADGTDYQYQWLEQSQIHQQTWAWPDSHVRDYVWDEASQTHTEQRTMADGTHYRHQWLESPQIHQQTWTWPDGYARDYLWDAGNALHHRTTTRADGTVHRYHWNEQQSQHETVYADGTKMLFQFPGPHQHLIQYSDGSFVHYDLITHKLTAHIVGDADVTIDGNTKIHCKANVDGTIDGNVNIGVGGKITAQAGSDINVHSDTLVTISAPYIVLNGLGGGKNVQFNGNFGFAGDVDVAGNVRATGVIEADEPMTAPAYNIG